MKKAILLTTILVIGSAVYAQNKYALVIGNADYTGNWNKLGNPVNDAVDIEAALKGLGFSVELIKNGSRSQMQTAVINFCRKLGAARNTYGFFYYAGHGAQDRNGSNYLIPVNANTQTLNQLPDEALSVRFVLAELEEAGNELNMIVLDACRNVPDGLRSGSRGLSVEANVPRGSIIMYATAAGKTASDGSGRNGLFTGHLLNNLKTPGLNVTEMFMRTGSDVATATGGDQYPEAQYKYFETAYLGTKPAATAPVTPAPTPVPTVQPAAQPPQRPVPDGFVRVEGGTFQMGSTNGDIDEKPVHTVTVKSFSISRTEVTQKEWYEVMGTNPSRFKGDDLPVEQVSWLDAIEYCNKRSLQEGLTPAYRGSGTDITCDWNANGYRLPTEAEWEFAAKGGIKDYLTTEYSGSNSVFLFYL